MPQGRRQVARADTGARKSLYHDVRLVEQPGATVLATRFPSRPVIFNWRRRLSQSGEPRDRAIPDELGRRLETGLYFDPYAQPRWRCS